jgi:hypothetical protein
MYKLVWTLDKDNFKSRQLSRFLDAHFHPESVKSSITVYRDREYSPADYLKPWGKGFKKALPRKKTERFGYLCRGTGAYPYLNYTGRACQKLIWPEFFRSFPRGKILLFELDDKWNQTIWQGMVNHARTVGFDKDEENYMHVAQDMSGLQSENFPFTALQVAAFGIYPLILFDMEHTSGKLTCVYVPPKAFQHAQMMEPGAFLYILGRLHHVFNDQWTFDGFRGPKFVTPSERIKPTQCLEFISWLGKNISERMEDLLSIEDVVRREQLAMTFNRAACDGILAAAAQLPYMSKVFLFACLDKLANILVQIGLFENDTSAWKHLVSDTFLSGELLEILRGIPSAVGECLTHIVQKVCLDIKIEEITPELLRDYRNSHHGYGLNRDSVERLFRHSGEIHNDVTLLSTPLVLYTLCQRWKVRG